MINDKSIESREKTLNLGIQDRLNISGSRARYIVDYIKMYSKGPEDVCSILKEIPLNFKGNEKYFAVYTASLFVIHHSDQIKKDKQNKFLDDMWNNAAKCFSFDLNKLLDISSDLLKTKDTLIEIINGQFTENEKIVLLFIYYLSMLGYLRRQIHKT